DRPIIPDVVVGHIALRQAPAASLPLAKASWCVGWTGGIRLCGLFAAILLGVCLRTVGTLFPVHRPVSAVAAVVSAGAADHDVHLTETAVGPLVLCHGPRQSCSPCRAPVPIMSLETRKPRAASATGADLGWAG